MLLKINLESYKFFISNYILENANKISGVAHFRGAVTDLDLDSQLKGFCFQSIEVMNYLVLPDEKRKYNNRDY